MSIDLLCRAVARRGYPHVTFEADEDGDGWIVIVGDREAWGRTGRSAIQNLLLQLERSR